MQFFFRNAVCAVWQVCHFQPAVIRLSVRLLTRSCIYLALERRRFDYRRTWQLLHRGGLYINHKRVYRHLSVQRLGSKAQAAP